MEENLVNQVPLYGDFFQCIRRLDAPSIDCLTSVPAEAPWFIARLVSSAAELEGKTVTMCETSDHVQRYRPAGDRRPVRQVTEAEIRGTCNRLIAGGINTLTSYYSFAGLSDAQIRRLNEWVGRCCILLKGGHHVTDIAVLFPVESLWPRFAPARHYANDSPSAAQIEHVFHAASDSLFRARRDFTYVDGRALSEARVDRGALVHGRLRWRAVVLPGADTLPLAAWENLALLVRGGGIVVALGALPANSETKFPSRRVQELAREIFGDPGDEPRVAANSAMGAGIYLPGGLEILLPAVFDSLLEPDIKVADAQAPLRLTHRRIDGHEVYLVINDSPESWTGPIRLASDGVGEQWDPATGRKKSLAQNGGIELALEAYGGALFRFAKGALPKRLPLRNGSFPALVLENLPAVSPTVGRGEFVREELALEPARTNAACSVWRAAGTLTKARVDTHLFLRFSYPQLPDLSRADFLAVESWVPEGQHTANSILAILHEQDGADYLANTGRSLGVSGRHQVYIPWSQFKLAGWSSDPNGALDLNRVTEIRIGWGGYFGAAGEKVEFSVSGLRTAKASSERGQSCPLPRNGQGQGGQDCPRSGKR